MVVTSNADPDLSPDITEFGAAFTLSVQPSGRYLAILEGFGQVSSESGILTSDGEWVSSCQSCPVPTSREPVGSASDPP